MTFQFASRMQRVGPSAIRELLRLGADPEVTSFGGGYPDATLFPTDVLSRLFRDVLEARGATALQYTVSNGIAPLRAQIAERARRDGIACDADQVLILNGGQQGLDLVAKMMLDPGDVVITEDPTFLGALVAFDPYEPHYRAVRMDAEGMDTDDLLRVLQAGPRAKFIYTVPDFQNPTGVTMSLRRRRRLLELAREFDLLVLEDTPYRALRFEGEAPPTLKSLDEDGRVIHLGSFSKLLAPGLRLGWAIADDVLIQRLGLLKLAADTQCGTLAMEVVSRFLDEYDLDAHVDRIRRTYRRKRDVMLRTIETRFPPQVAFTRPQGGMFTWLTFPAGFDAARFMAGTMLPRAKVAYVPGESFFPVAGRPNHARISYSTQDEDTIVRGMTTLGELLTEVLG
ncbi:aminotransferase-like domain-containing protein [Gluconacetobacter tumulisoli]|uniref:PLP-dependent aminotransferase family protein n=1 Tax=Gluconacetobacter tumulisoli TaxID=1286189 RepID=A0A7W4PK19_9PROT|nr:PLP-dependent aminotransferase family protein [Gluconacetobacter tumulisoli]MBB2200947.1 PLP-dependent aminotransferase family protein [Gluconacetobacter tumulisoli]